MPYVKMLLRCWLPSEVKAMADTPRRPRPECFMCRSVIRTSEARMLSGGQWVHTTCAAETAGVQVRYGR